MRNRRTTCTLQGINSSINLQLPENVVICDINNILISKSLVNKKSLNELFSKLVNLSGMKY